MINIISIDKALEYFLLDRELKGNSIKTINNYRQFLGYFVDYIGSDFDVSLITLNHLKEYQLYLSKKNKYENHPFAPKKAEVISKTTLQSYIRHLRAFIKFLYEEEYLLEDITLKFKLPKADKKIIEVLDEDEIIILLDSMPERSELQVRNKCIIVLMLDSGLRRNEVLTLHYDNVYISQSCIKVFGKGNKERLVPIGLLTKKLLLKYMNTRSLPEYETKKLFIDKNKKPMSDNSLKMIYTRLRKKTGIIRLHPHILRHTFATQYLINGGDIFSLQQILGHTSLEMVRRYSHLASSYIIANHKRLSPLDTIQRSRSNF